MRRSHAAHVAMYACFLGELAPGPCASNSRGADKPRIRRAAIALAMQPIR